MPTFRADITAVRVRYQDTSPTAAVGAGQTIKLQVANVAATAAPGFTRFCGAAVDYTLT